MLIRLLLVGFTLFLAWLIYLANSGQPGVIITYVKLVPFGDKAGHLILTGILTLLANLALDCKYFSIGKLKILVGTLIVSVIVFLEEYSQLYIPSRTFSLWDLLSDFIGITLFSILAILIQKFRDARESKSPRL